ncbi:MAG: heavy-metal-associated domain-containing protein [Bacteroidota bacterium]
MQRTIIVILTAMVAFAFGCSAKEDGKRGVVEISLPSVKCDMCVAMIEKTVKEIEGVKSISIDLETKTGMVEFEKGFVDQTSIENAIAAVGMTPIRPGEMNRRTDNFPVVANSRLFDLV